jgi:hypothetical protein
VPQSQAATPHVETRVAETSGNVSSGSAEEAPVASESIFAAEQRRVALIGDSADFPQIERLQKELESRGIYAVALEGHLVGSNLPVKLAPNVGNSTILFCLGASMAHVSDPSYISKAVGEDRIPVIMESIEGGDLNEMFRSRIYFDIREPGGFEKLVRYLTTGSESQ